MKFDTVTAQMLAIGSFTLINVLAILVFWLYRKHARIIDDRLQKADLAATKAELRASAIDERLKALEDKIQLTYQFERLKGKLDAYDGLVRSFSSTMIKQVSNYALSNTRADLHQAVAAELEALIKKYDLVFEQRDDLDAE